MIERIDYSAIRVDSAAVYCQMKYKATAQPSPKVSRIVEELLEQAEQLASPCCAFVTRKIEQVSESFVTIEGGVCFHSQVISDLLSGSTDVIVYALTIGPGIEEKARCLADEEMLFDSFVFDAIGTCLTQNLSRLVQRSLDDIASHRGLSASRRFCPGYCDWDVSQQKAIFEVLGENSPGIRVTDRYLMLPHKSMSGIVGIGHPDNQVRSYIPCRNCVCGRADRGKTTQAPEACSAR